MAEPTRPEPFDCFECGSVVRPSTGVGRKFASYRGILLPVPDEMFLTSCTNPSCGRTYLSLEEVRAISEAQRPEVIRIQVDMLASSLDLLAPETVNINALSETNSFAKFYHQTRAAAKHSSELMNQLAELKSPLGSLYPSGSIDRVLKFNAWYERNERTLREAWDNFQKKLSQGLERISEEMDQVASEWSCCDGDGLEDE